MSFIAKNSCPLLLHIPASLVGVMMAILNPSPEFIIPAVLAVFMMYPWLFRKLRATLLANTKPEYFKIGLYFSFYVSVLTALLLSVFTFKNGLVRIAPESWYSYPLVFLYLIFFYGLAAVMLTPVISVFGYLYALANYHIIKKYYHPNVEAKS